jgi:very-short-patch-repair endonuclease
MTKEERHLWYDFLHALPVTVHRQRVIGNYIVDFYIASARLVIELDGSQHFTADGRGYDRERDAFLTGLGLTVLRYANSDISKNFSGVCQDILHHINPPQPSSVPTGHLLPMGEGFGLSHECGFQNAAPAAFFIFLKLS